MATAPRPRWVRTDGRLVRIDDESDAQLVEERQRHLADRIKAHGDQVHDHEEEACHPDHHHTNKTDHATTIVTATATADAAATTPSMEEPVEHPPPAFTVPDPTNLEFHYPDNDTDAGDAPYAYIQPDVEAYQRLP
ncbi:hypothetical protein SeLEV6574_g05360 [Synchytrium endobioticum]|uniref:Uncharacterized protein n=1 Tax=Synchytrium endobioticum TaxID=286115 RepID=A0A507CUU1_9FUNG|nr:hypothetical protein SeLEV6574_g05360 [Synchytrium endobioticum]